MSEHWIILALIAATLAEGAGVFFAIDAIARGRTAQGTVAWALALVFVPPIAVPLYFMIGARRFDGYIRARRRGNQAIDQLATYANEAMEPFTLGGAGSTEHDRRSGARTAIQRLARTDWTTGNRTTLLIDGEATFAAILAELELATRDICIQFYIVRADELGWRLHTALLAAAARGVTVRFLYDSLGSKEIAGAFVDELVEAGIFAEAFHSRRNSTWFRLNFRNHRKIVIVDGRTAFIGGHNVGLEYLGLDPEMGAWRDTHIRIDGPAVLAAQLSFAEDWNSATGTVADLTWTCESRGDERVLIVPSGPGDPFETCALMFHQVIQSAQHRLWIASPYFVPDEGIVLNLQLASLRGVDTRILIPDRSDNPWIHFSAYSYYEDIMPAGVDLYRYHGGFLHHKVFLCDDVAGIGTANFDNRSFRINFEVTVIVAGGPLANQVEEMFAHDLQRSTRASLSDFTRKSSWFRARARISRLMSPLQ